MLDQVFKDPGPDRPTGSDPPAPRRKPPYLPPALTLPAILLLLMGLIVYLFGLLSFDHRNPVDLIREIRTSTGDRKALLAFELSRLESYGLAPEERRLFLDLAVRSFREAGGQDRAVRRALALTLGRIGDPEAVPALVGSLQDSDAETQLYCVWALAAIGDRRAVHPILAGLRHDDTGIRKMAAFALGQIGDAEAVPGLRVALQDPATDVAWNAAVALVRLGEPAGLPPLLPILEKRYPPGAPALTPRQDEDLRINILRALRGFPGDQAAEVLRRVAEDDPSPRIRGEARRALEGKAAAFPVPPPLGH